MALVEVGRFLDLAESQVVAAALRSSGMFVFEQNDVAARFNYNLLYAFGGVRLWVSDADAADALAFISAHRCQPSTLAPLPPIEATVRMLVSLFLTSVFGLVIPLRPRRPERLDDD